MSRLQSKTEPETGTTSYTYNWDGTLASRTDARNQTVTYTYDSNKRMTSKFGATLYYDTNPFGTSENTTGRLAAVEYEGMRESYGYTRGGRMKWKRLTTGDGAVLAASWQWDNEGRMARVTYPLNEADYTYSYDTMGRLSGIGRDDRATGLLRSTQLADEDPRPARLRFGARIATAVRRCHQRIQKKFGVFQQ